MTKCILPVIERLRDEKLELAVKLTKLNDFLAIEENWRVVGMAQWILMKEQSIVMMKYWKVLTARYELFTGSKKDK